MMERGERAGKLKEPYKSLLLRLVEALKESFGNALVSVAVFGSVARGEAGRDSDVDLLVVAEGLPNSKLRRQDIFMEVEEKLEPDVEEAGKEGYHIEFSPVLRTPGEVARLPPLLLDMVEDAVILYDKGGFLRGLLDQLRRRLEELGAERVRCGKLWYWRLKRDYRFGEVIEV